MEQLNLLKDLIQRTGGDVYVGVVGPVRAGKSTFIKKFMEMLVLPKISDPDDYARAKDELPQSGTGRMIMTTEPKFIPNEAVEITLPDNASMRVRLVDCVGFTVAGAQGYEDEDGPRMVLTPWHEEPISFSEAAEIGTNKVIQDHSTIGIVVTTDGTVTDLERADYAVAEDKVVAEMKKIEKPFVLILNTATPESEETLSLKKEIEEKHDIAVLPVNVCEMSNDDLYRILQDVLYEFPVQEINITFPAWLENLKYNHWLYKQLHNYVNKCTTSIRKVRDVMALIQQLEQSEHIEYVVIDNMQLGEGFVALSVKMPDDLFTQVLSELTGETINKVDDLVPLLYDYVVAKKEYDYIKEALQTARRVGYGIVPPHLKEMALEEPQIIRQGNRFGVRLKASAPAYHFVRIDVESEVAPIIGSEKQSEELIKYLLDEFEADPKRLWESNIFGKSLQTLVEDGIKKKLYNMPENAQEKLREALQKIVNEGNGGLIAIIL